MCVHAVWEPVPSEALIRSHEYQTVSRKLFNPSVSRIIADYLLSGDNEYLGPREVSAAEPVRLVPEYARCPSQGLLLTSLFFIAIAAFQCQRRPLSFI